MFQVPLAVPELCVNTEFPQCICKVLDQCIVFMECYMCVYVCIQFTFKISSEEILLSFL
jgi:hypothetical protein